jgi:hypothetical protein
MMIIIMRKGLAMDLNAKVVCSRGFSCQGKISLSSVVDDGRSEKKVCDGT